MATTQIHAITSTPHLALRYCMSDKVEELNVDKEINNNIPYNVFDDNGKKYVKYVTLNSFLNCNSEYPFSSYEEKRETWQNKKYTNNGTRAKDGKEPLMYHLYQSFKGWEVSPTVANEIGRKLAEEVFKGYTVTVSTHSNTDNVHNHFIISAWDDNGRKWDNCHKTTNQIRRVSDRLCKEYGLDVLEKTSQMNLIKYYDKDGKIHYYEPTELKDRKIAKRRQGDITTDDVNSYRNSEAYADGERKLLDNRTEIKNDIDVLLPTCNSYEELLYRLREMGYTIRDKKKNGEWLAHVSFKAPLHQRATREDNIGDGKFYLRENLEKYFSEREVNNVRPHGEDGLVFYPEYDYGKIDVSKINEEYKVVNVDGQREIRERTPLERKVIKDVKAKDVEVKGLIDTTTLERLIEEQRNGISASTQSRRHQHELIEQIRSSLRCLNYTEKNNVANYEHLLSSYRNYKTKYENAVVFIDKSEKSIHQLKRVLSLPAEIQRLKQRIENNKSDVQYLLESYSKDEYTLRKWEEEVKNAKIDTEKGYASLLNKVNEFEQRQNANREQLERIKKELSELDNCMRTYIRIDTENGARDEKAISTYESIKIGEKIKTEKGQEK